MKITNKIDINAPAATIWETVGTRYEDAGKWASAVYASRAKPGETMAKNAPVAGRICQTSLGPFTESIVRFDAENYQLAYVASGDKMPGFVRELKGIWTIRPCGPSKSEVEMRFSADIAPPFNVLMGWMMKRQFNKAISESIEDLKHYIEKGKPHPRKVAVDASKKAVRARQETVGV